MTKVKLKKGSVSMTGHADFEDFGKDIVCAAMSQLIFAFSEALLRAEEDGYVKVTSFTMEPGIVNIQYISRDKRVKGMEDMLKAGFEMLSEKYPMNVKI